MHKDWMFWVLAMLLFGSGAAGGLLFSSTNADFRSLVHTVNWSPAWVQALGSIAAIGAAIWIASSQRSEQIRAEKNSLLVSVRSIKVITERLQRSMKGPVNSPGDLMRFQQMLRGLCEGFGSIVLWSLPDHRLVEPVCTIRDALTGLRTSLDTMDMLQQKIKYMNTDVACINRALALAAAGQILEAISAIEKH